MWNDEAHPADHARHRHTCRRAQGSALGRAQDVRGDERVLKRALIGGAGGRKTAAHKRRQENARKADVEEQRRLLIGPGLSKGNHAIDQHRHGLTRLDGIPAEHERARAERNQQHRACDDDDVCPMAPQRYRHARIAQLLVAGTVPHGAAPPLSPSCSRPLSPLSAARFILM